MNPKILIAGSGAIGGIIAAILAKNNFDITLQTNHPEFKTSAKKDGIQIIGFCGSFKQKMKTVLPSDLADEIFDIVMIATKATDMVEVARKLLPFINEESMVVSLQNGICEDALAEVVGKERTVGCVVGWGATMVNRTTLEMTSGGFNIIGTIDQIPEEKLKVIKGILETVVPTYISTNIYGSLYSKLIINSCITTLGAISGNVLGKMLSKKIFRNIFVDIMREAMNVAIAMNLKVEPYLGKIDYYKFLGKDSFVARLKRDITIRVIGYKFRKLKSSSLQSLERGRPTEIDFFNGYFVRKAKEFNVHVPLNEKLVSMVKEIESGKRAIGMENFQDPFFEKYH
jgi:2-dehydropantoate 2-reductase